MTALPRCPLTTTVPALPRRRGALAAPLPLGCPSASSPPQCARGAPCIARPARRPNPSARRLLLIPSCSHMRPGAHGADPLPPCPPCPLAAASAAAQSALAHRPPACAWSAASRVFPCCPPLRQSAHRAAPSLPPTPARPPTSLFAVLPAQRWRCCPIASGPSPQSPAITAVKRSRRDPVARRLPTPAAAAAAHGAAPFPAACVAAHGATPLLAACVCALRAMSAALTMLPRLMTPTSFPSPSTTGMRRIFLLMRMLR